MSLFAANEDWESLTRVVCTHAEGLIGRGQFLTVQKWIQLAPEPVRAAIPWLLFWLGSATAIIDVATGRALLERAFAAFRSADDPIGTAHSWASVVETFIHEWGRLQPLDEWILAFERSIDMNRIAELDPKAAARLCIAMFCALMYRQPDNPQLPFWEQQTRDLVLSLPDPRVQITIGYQLLLYYTIWTGQLPKAKVLVDDLQPVLAHKESQPLAKVGWYAVESYYLWMIGDNAESINAVERGLEAAETSGVCFWNVWLLAGGVYATRSEGDLDGATRYLDRLAQEVEPSRLVDAAHVSYLRSWVKVLQGDVSSAVPDAEHAVRATVEAGAPYPEAIMRIARAHAAIALDDYECARSHLDVAHDIGQRMRSPAVEYLCLVPFAVLALRCGDRESALRALRRLFVVAREQGFVNDAFWWPPLMADLAVDAIANDIEVDYVQHLIRVRGLHPSTPPHELRDWPWDVTISTLGGLQVAGDAGRQHGRPHDLLAVLIALGGRDVVEHRLCDTLWPDAEGEKAHQNLATTLHRLRKLLPDGVLRHENGTVSLDPARCWLDIWAAQRLLAATHPPGTEGSERALDDLIHLYTGPFLSERNDPWVLATRSQLQRAVVSAIAEHCRFHSQDGEHERALTIAEKGLLIDDTSQQLYQHAIRAHAALGQKAEAHRTLERCREALAEQLDTSPSEATMQLAEMLRGPRLAGEA